MKSKINQEIGDEPMKNQTGTSGLIPSEYGKKEVYNGTNQTKDFGSESVHDVDYKSG